MYSDSEPAYNFVGRKETDTFTDDNEPSYFIVDLVKFKARITDYTLRYSFSFLFL